MQIIIYVFQSYWNSANYSRHVGNTKQERTFRQQRDAAASVTCSSRVENAAWMWRIQPGLHPGLLLPAAVLVSFANHIPNEKHCDYVEELQRKDANHLGLRGR